MKLGEIFLGKGVHWALWLVIIAVLFALGEDRLHVRRFVPFIFIVLGMTGAAFAIIIAAYRKGQRITREPLEEGEQRQTPRAGVGLRSEEDH